MADRKIRVRIRVCVDAKGNWNSAGWRSFSSEGNAMHYDANIVDGMPGGSAEAWYWIEADVPLPSEATIEGSVNDG